MVAVTALYDVWENAWDVGLGTFGIRQARAQPIVCQTILRNKSRLSFSQKKKKKPKTKTKKTLSPPPQKKSRQDEGSKGYAPKLRLTLNRINVRRQGLPTEYP